MKKYWPGLCLLATVLLAGCTKDRINLIQDATQFGPYRGFILINEYMAKETKAPSINEQGVPADWIELYVPGTDTLHLQHGKWFITDDFNVMGKYALPTVDLAPGQHYVIWCDHDDTIPGLHDVHANFNLSAKGEQIGLYYLNPGVNDTLAYDTRVFGAQTDDISEGRFPDGGSDWKTFTTPTPGAPNQ